VKLLITKARPVTTVAREFGLKEQELGRWVTKIVKRVVAKVSA